jgi:hypothetical protein
MLALRRVSTIYQYIHPLSSYQYRLKSKKSTNDESKQKPTHLSEELLDFEQKNINTSRNLFKNKKHLTNEDRIEKKQAITRKLFNFISYI